MTFLDERVAAQAAMSELLAQPGSAATSMCVLVRSCYPQFRKFRQSKSLLKEVRLSEKGKKWNIVRPFRLRCWQRTKSLVLSDRANRPTG